MPAAKLSRRHFLSLSSAAAAAAAGAASPFFVPSAAGASTPGPRQALDRDIDVLPIAVERGFKFLDRMMDAYATGSTVRLAQSYSDQAPASSLGTGQNYQGLLGPVGLLYDNAVAIHAYLARGDAAALARAEILGQGLLYAQTHLFSGSFNASFISGLAQAYVVNQADSDGVYIAPTLAEIEGDFYNYSPRRLGDLAWAGMAMLQLYKRTGANQYLVGAEAIGNGIVVINPPPDAGFLGFGWGTVSNEFNGTYNPAPFGRSTEFNIAAGAFFNMLAVASNGGTSGNLTPWATYAQYALAFAVAEYEPSGPLLYVGTTPDQKTVVGAPGPESCQSWSYMALLDTESRGTLDWAIANLSTVDTATAPYSSLAAGQSVAGLGYSTTSLAPTASDPQAVWLEGTSHMAAALAARVLQGGRPLSSLLSDIRQAIALLNHCADAQQALGRGQTVGGQAIPSGLGLVAASSVTDAGDVNVGIAGVYGQLGFIYGPWLHLGSTAWFLLANLAANPFQLGL